MRPIDADALERMGYVLTRTYKQDKETMVYETKKLSDVPTAQPERKKGHWVEIGDEPYDEWECDVCGFVIDGSGCIDPEEYRDVYRFCPRCGARMER